MHADTLAEVSSHSSTETLNPKLVHGWENIKNLNFYSSLGLSTLKTAKWYPTMSK